MIKNSFSLFSEHFSKCLDKVWGKEIGKDKVPIANGTRAHPAVVCAGAGFDFRKLPRRGRS